MTIHRPHRIARPPKRKYVKYEQDKRTGKWYAYFRRGKAKLLPLRGLPGDPEFEQDYRDALAGKLNPKARRGENGLVLGSVDFAVEQFYKSSLWASWKPATQRNRRFILERFRNRRDKKGIRLGEKQIRAIEWRHVDRWIAEMWEQRGAASNFLQTLRALFVYAIKAKLRSDDPSQNIALPPKANDSGWHTWTDEEMAHYETSFPTGTKRRLAYALAYYTTARCETIARLGPQHIVGDRLEFRPTKTDGNTAVALSLPIHPELARLLKQTPPDNLTFLVNDQAMAFTANALSGWFKWGCQQIGIGHCSIHGLRKAACRVMAENGASTKQIASFTGHATLRSLEIYVKNTDQRRLSDAGIEFLSKKPIRVKSGTSATKRIKIKP